MVESWATRHRSELLALAVLLLSGVVLRLIFFPTPGARDDMECFPAWANIFRVRPIGDFYAFDAPESDYLPGYLYLLAATTWVRGLFVESPASYQPFTLWIKLAPMAGDLILSIAVYVLCRRFVGPTRSLLSSALTLLNPGLVFVSAVWGQVDSIGVALCMLALVAMVYGRLIPAAALGGVAFITKPQYGLFLVVAAVAYVSSEARRLPAPGAPGFRSTLSRWSWNSVLVPAAVLVGTVEILLRPFSVSLLPLGEVEWSVFQRLAMATDNFPVTSTTALNLWATPLAGLRIPDSTPAWLSLSYQSWGWLLLAVVLTVAVAAAWRRPNDVVVLLWSCSLASIGLFMLLTRIHERYLFAAIPLLAAGAVLSRRFIPAFVGVSALYLLNVWASYSAQMGGPRMGAGPLGWMVPAAAVIGIAMLAYAIAALLVAQSRGQPLAPIPLKGELWLRKSTQMGGSRRVHSVRAQDGWPRIRTSYLLAALAGISVIALGFSVGRMVGADATGVRTVTVRAYKQWQDTGIRVSEGQSLAIYASGEWTNKRGAERFGPEGGKRTDGGTIMPEVPIGVLLASIDGGPPLPVRTGTIVSAPAAGQIRLVMNDWLEDRSDAQGSVRVRIVAGQQ